MLKLLREREVSVLRWIEADAERVDLFLAPLPRVVLELVLRAKGNIQKPCSLCGAKVERTLDVREGRLVDLPLGDGDSWLVHPRNPLPCPRRGPTSEAVRCPYSRRSFRESKLPSDLGRCGTRPRGSINAPCLGAFP